MYLSIVNKFPKVSTVLGKLAYASEFYKYLAVTVIVISNLMQFALKPAGFRQGDSWAYGFSNDRNWDLVSLSGHALRKWPLVLTNTLLADTQLQVFTQVLFSCFAWIYLVLVIAKFYRTTQYLVLVVGVLGSLRQIVSWNSIHLSESWSISSMVIVIALIISTLKEYQRVKMFILGIFLLIALNTKPSTLLATLLVMVLFSLGLILSKKFGVIRKKKVITVGVLTLVLYSSFLNVNQANQNLQTEGSGQSYAAAQSVAVITNINPQASSVINSISNIKELKCLEISDLKSPIELTELMKFKCHSAENWLTENFASWYIEFLLRNPAYVLKSLATSLSAGNTPFSMYGGSISIIPDSVSELFFGNRNYANRLNQDSAQDIAIQEIQIISPIYIWLILGVFFFSYLMTGSRRPRSGPQLQLRTAYGLLVFHGIVTMLISGVLIPNEWFRQSIVGQAEILIGTILLFGEYQDSKSRENNDSN